MIDDEKVLVVLRCKDFEVIIATTNIILHNFWGNNFFLIFGSY